MVMAGESRRFPDLTPPSGMVTFAYPNNVALTVIVMMGIGIHAAWGQQRLAYHLQHLLC